ncbi:protein of unknown function [Salinimicrobium sediminis]|uniref:Lin1244/Lin1753-like N-terminal domain-containing protein n=1 Tax=Salinimicrobium sediminis TaxID=1343891 RepID=A0A285X3F3_9FLAO|nr:DUF4373 domain-containing protein [Salinimicrobium sediminis]SOC79842.1 protein of unknown function [Salinimicrobium sediminis]
MARPKKLNADYFSHDADMRNDPKIKALRRKYGIQGYAIWNMMLEVLTDADFFEYEWTTLNIELLAGDFDVEPKILEEVIDYCVMLKLIQKEEDLIFSEKLQERFESLLSKRNRDRKQKETAKPTPKTEKKEVFDSEKPQSKVKESKVKESKVKERESELSPSRAFELLKIEKSEELNIFEMQNKKQVKQWQDMIDNFNDTVEIEISKGKIDFEADQLLPRLRKWTRSWLRNQTNHQPETEKYTSTAPERF